jgi:hypothetical protein
LAVSMSSPIIPPSRLATITEALLLKLFEQLTPPSTYPVAFTGWVLSCRVDRDSVHMQRTCHRMRVHSIALPLLHRREGHLLHRRPWDLPRR